MIRLGEMLGSLYSSLLSGPGGLPSPSHVAVRATDNPWSVMSAQAVLRGMFPGKVPFLVRCSLFSFFLFFFPPVVLLKWCVEPPNVTSLAPLQWVIPDSVPREFVIRVNSEADDVLLMGPSNCPLYKFDLAQSIESPNNPEWARLQQRASPLLQHFRHMYVVPPLTEADITLQNWDSFFDPVECYRANNLEISPKNLSVAQMIEILKIGNKLEQMRFPPVYGGLLGGNLMRNILQAMRDAANATLAAPRPVWLQKPRLHLFSGHKETISALMAMLNQTIEAAPTFGDRLDLELIWDPTRRTHVVQVRQNGRRPLVICDRGETLCDFDKFEASMQSHSKADWGLTCQRQESLRCMQQQKLTTAGDAENSITLILSPINGLWYLVSGGTQFVCLLLSLWLVCSSYFSFTLEPAAAALLIMAFAVLVFWKWRRGAQPNDVPEEIPLQPAARRGPKKFTLE
jgi:hypothetical protein